MNCALCGYEFDKDGLNCHSKCPMSDGCHIICCPNCGYQVGVVVQGFHSPINSSAINSIKNEAGKADPKIGAAAMQQAVDVHRTGSLRGLPVADYVPALKEIANRRRLSALQRALAQRYPD